VAGLRALKANPRVDPGNVFIVGLSIGGVEAPLIEREEKVKGVVAINTAAKPFLEYWIETRRRQMLLRGTPHDEVDAAMARSLRCNYAVLIEREAPQDLLKRSPECRGEVEFPAPHTFMQQWAALHMGEAWTRVDSPVLVVIGKSDFIATVEESPYLVDMLNRYRPGRATLKAIDGMDHFLTKAPSMRASQERQEPGEFEPAVLDATVAWLRQHSS
jgi:pimeloyl-ACP methyl ester carboxylesterase